MLGILVHGDNHFIVSGPKPSEDTVMALVRQWSVIRIGEPAVTALEPWSIVKKAFRENLEWAYVTPAETEISVAVLELLDELRARGIEVVTLQGGS